MGSLTRFIPKAVVQVYHISCIINHCTLFLTFCEISLILSCCFSVTIRVHYFLLQFEAVESSENLPESLDIGDVPESGTSSESASLNLKSVVGEASSSSSGSSAVVS